MSRRTARTVLGMVCAAGLAAAAAFNPASAINPFAVGKITYQNFTNVVLPALDLGPGFGLNDAAESDKSRSDALDGGMHLTLNGVAFKDADGEFAPIADDTNLGAGGQVLTATGKAAGLKVTAKVGMFAGVNGERARVHYLLRNKSTKKRSVTAVYTNNLGSDGNTVVERTSDGDALLQAADSWVVASNDGATDDDVVTTVVNTIAFGDRAHAYKYQGASLGGTADTIGVRFNFKIRPGRSAQLLFVHQFEDEVQFAEQGAEPEFDTFANLTATGLTSGLRGRFVNWNTP